MTINQSEIEKQYLAKKKDYEELGNILLDRINKILKEHETAFDYVQMRIKKFDSFYDKIFREQLTNPDKQSGETDPFKTNKDFVGLRVIHLFDDDLNSIVKILEKEFQINKEDKKDLTRLRRKSEREFTYRSYHVFVRLKGELKKSHPHLSGMVAEVQIRTICMHTWASIEHKLNYKKQDSLPKDYRPIITRKFSQMSAVLEISDEFFMALRNEKNNIIKQYKANLSDAKKKEVVLKEELNIEALQAYIEKKYSRYPQEKRRIKSLLEEMTFAHIGLNAIEIGEQSLKDKNFFKHVIDNYPSPKEEQTQTGVVRLILDITDDDFYEVRKLKMAGSKWIKFVDAIRLKVKES